MIVTINAATIRHELAIRIVFSLPMLGCFNWELFALPAYSSCWGSVFGRHLLLQQSAWNLPLVTCFMYRAGCTGGTTVEPQYVIWYIELVHPRAYTVYQQTVKPRKGVPQLMANILIGNAPCSWGTLEFEGFGENQVTAAQMLDELAETGYAATELGDWGFLPTDPGVLADELRGRGLVLTGAFVPVALRYPQTHEAGEQAAVRAARLLTAVADRNDQSYRPYLVLADDNGTDPVRTQNAGRATYAIGMSSAERQMFSTGANRVAKAVHDATGLRTVFHHHCAGVVETPDEI
jgi:hypothetical protein